MQLKITTRGRLHFEKEGGTVRSLPVSELPVKSDGKYQATLWLRNPGPGRRLYN